MGNIENLILYTSDQSREEAKKNGKKGGVASGIARRKKANFKNILTQILEDKPPEALREFLRQAGVTDVDNINCLEALLQLCTLRAGYGETEFKDVIKYLDFAMQAIGQKTPDQAQSVQQVFITQGEVNEVNEHIDNVIDDSIKGE